MHRRVALAAAVAVVAACGGDDEAVTTTAGATTVLATADTTTTTTITPTTTPTTTTTATTATTEVPMTTSPADPTVAVAVADLAARLAVDVTEIDVLSVEAVTWRDGSLGCPEPGRSYTQALVAGQRILLAAGGEQYAYHSGRGREPFYCPPERAEDPSPDPRV